MDPLLDPSIYNRLKKKVKVHIGSLKEELKLVVKIDKTLVQLPKERGKSKLEHSTGQKSLNRKAGSGRIFQKHSTLSSGWEQHPYICKSVDSTFLCNLVNYANQSPSKHRKDIVQAARRGRRFKKAPSRIPPVRIRKSQNLILRREDFNPDWNPLKGWKIHYRDIYVNQLLDSSKLEEPHPPLSSEMEHVMLNGGLKEYSPILKGEEIDFNLRAKMIVASAIQNNNKLKAGDGLLNSQKHPQVDGGSPTMTEGPLVKFENGDNERTLETIPGDALDQTVPQLPVIEDENQLSAPSPSSDKADDEVTPKVSDCSDAHGDQSPCRSESGLEAFEYNSHAEGIRVNGHSSSPEAPSAENGLGNQTRSETPAAEASIGEQVDEEIKALLDDVNFEGPPTAETGNSELVRSGCGQKIINSALSPMFVVAEQERRGDTRDRLSPQQDHGHHNNIGDAETWDNNQQNLGKTQDDAEEVDIPPSGHEIDDGPLPTRTEQADQLTETEHLPSAEDLSMDTAEASTGEVHSEGDTVQSKMAVESDEVDDSVAGDQSSLCMDSDQNGQQQPDDDGAMQAMESSRTGLAPADEQSIEDKPPVSLPEESHSLLIEFQVDPKGVSEAAEEGENEVVEKEMVKQARDSEEQLGRKGLKLQQSQSLKEAEVTSEPAEVTSSDVPAVEENVPPSEGSISPVSERSQSVIVSNPRSLSKEESQGFHEGKSINLKIVKSELVEEEVKSGMVDDGRENSSTLPARVTDDDPTAILDHPELFQALTPPPAQMRGRGSRSRKAYPQHPNRTTKGKSQDTSQRSIQITSVQTLAPLTDHERDPSIPPFVNGRHAALAQQGLVALDRRENDAVFIHQKLMRQHSMILQSPPQPMDIVDMRMDISNPPPLMDLSRKTPTHTFMRSTRGSGEPTMNELSPRVHDMSMRYHTESPGELLGHLQEEDNLKDSIIAYDPVEHQHHFMEIKRRLLGSKSSAVPKEFDPEMYDIPHSGHAVPIDPRNEGHPHLPSHTRVDALQNMPKIPSPLGKFSGAMMEHVKHWKSQNEQTNQASRPGSTEKIQSHPSPPQPQLYQRVAPQPPHAVPVVPMNLAPNHAQNHPHNLPKQEKKVPELPPGKVNTALLENLQAIHKMYFKTMQGTDKVLFPKMPSSKNAVPIPTSVLEPVPMVKRFMPPPSGPPHLMPRFPPEGQVPPELLNFHMNAIAGNIPPPPQLSPSAQKILRHPMDPQGFAPDGHRLRFHNMSGNFPRPFLPPQMPPQQFQKIIDGNGKVFMVPVPPGVHRFPPQLLQPPGHLQVIPREMLRAEAPVGLASPQALQKMLVPTRPILLTDNLPHQKEPVEIQHAIEAASAYAKRKAAEGTPLDLTTKPAKVRRLSGDDGVPDGDQPMDLSVKVREEDTTWKPTEVPTMEDRHIVLPGSQPPHHLMDIATSAYMPPRGLPRHYSIPSNQFIAQPAMNGFHNLQSCPVGVRPTISNAPIPVPTTSPQQRMPSIEPQHLLRMPTPQELEMVKMMVRNSSQFLPPGAILHSPPAKHHPGDVPPQLITHPDSTRHLASDVTLDHCFKKKRGRPRGSTNRRRYAQPPPVLPPLQIVESSTPPVPLVPSIPTSSPSDTAECQFCDFKAPTRGDVRQHVKAVHFAKFRRDSSKSCEALTPTSEYTVRMIGHPDQRNVQLTSVPDQGELRQGSHQRSAGSPENYSDSEGPRLVIDTGGIQTGIKEEMHSPTGADQLMTPPHHRVTQESINNGYSHSEKPPLKITLRRVSSTGDNSPPVFSPLPQEKSPPERKPKYSCGTCGASYNYINGLREHESRHKVDLPYECGICHLKYKTMGMLSRHKAQKNHQGP